jgi:hypothetical protein
VEIGVEQALKAGILGSCLLLGGCADSGDRGDQSSGSPEDSDGYVPTAVVRIVSPSDGDTLASGVVTVRLEVEGLVVVPAGVEQASSGHHHLLVDAPLPALDLPVPSEAGRYIHLGKGQTEFLLEELDIGEHRVIALVGDHMHVPLSPPVADTVRFVVR